MEIKLHTFFVLSLPSHHMKNFFTTIFNFNEFVYVVNIRFICDGEIYLLTLLLYIPWIVMFLEFTNTKVSTNNKLHQPSSSFRIVTPCMMTLKSPSSSSICSSKSLKYSNYGKATYITFYYNQSTYTNFFTRLFI